MNRLKSESLWGKDEKDQTYFSLIVTDMKDLGWKTMILQYNTVQYSTVHYSLVVYSIVQYTTV